MSPETHSPLWAAEHLWSDDIEAAWKLPRPHVPFAPDPRVKFSAGLADYHGSFFDRGHMAPSGDQPTPDDQAETFYLSNIVPQTASLNEGIWSRIESRVRGLAEKEGELYVVTGPAYHLRPVQTIGPDRVPVPSSTWKAVYSPSRGRAGVYVCKNAQQHPHCDQVTVQTLTRNTGIDPFPAISEQVKAQAWRLPAP
uniref:Endonuclease n=1 Tax=Acetobacter pasteurianus TaxID=438 RepID=I3W053_ACEPA|nr:endonuclease [Acetobacter pasteurianus]